MNRPYVRARFVEALAAVNCVPVTCFGDRGQLNLNAQAELMKRLYAAGHRVFMIGAGTGEFWDLEPAEVATLTRVVRESTGDNAYIFSAVDSPTFGAIRAACDCMANGADGIMFMPPGNNYRHDDGLGAFYRRVVREAKAPAIVYKNDDLPGDGLLLELAKEELIFGVKYAIADINRVRLFSMALRNQFGERLPRLFGLVCGNAERFAPSYFRYGCRGYTSGAVNLVPRLTLALHRALTDGRHEESLRLAEAILPIEDLRAGHNGADNVNVLKFGLQHLLHIDAGSTRCLLRSLPEAEWANVRAVLERALAAEAALPA